MLSQKKCGLFHDIDPLSDAVPDAHHMYKQRYILMMQPDKSKLAFLR